MQDDRPSPLSSPIPLIPQFKPSLHARPWHVGASNQMAALWQTKKKVVDHLWYYFPYLEIPDTMRRVCGR